MPADGHPEDTYYESSDDEGQAATDEIDAFEARLRGDAPPAKKSAPLAPKVPQQKVAVKKGSDYVNSAVKSKAATKSDEQLEAAEAQAAVSDLDRFEQRLGR
uniref:Uncharacterized protein n=1 Tax=Prymnesium polylepis TaxID=72548 RepID=A0A6T8A4W2_9EUKA|mmetsp:Transcript_48372/g.134073  ORF Transcript_48372/g.134073 Transcript_48372/m.134073 type:complete len:102 (+) Transcript_48372:53-358(+)